MSGYRTVRGRLALTLVLLSTTACANSLTSYRTERFGLDGPRVITQDAKTRNLVMLPPQGGAGSDATRQWRVCAEAAPDVFSALSASASADLGLNTRGSGTEAQARAAMAIAEAAGTIERTQTINMLRESMYRTCERYMSGGIDRATLAVQAGRDLRAMIAILAIEQLTRNTRPAPTIIAAGSTSAAVEGASEAVRQLIIAQGEEERTQQRLTTATRNKPASCEPLTDTNRAACTEFNEATAAHNRAVQRVQTWESVAKTVGQSEGRASTQPPPAQNPGNQQQGNQQQGNQQQGNQQQGNQQQAIQAQAQDPAPAFHPAGGGGGLAPGDAAPPPPPPPPPASPPPPSPPAPAQNSDPSERVALVVQDIVSRAFDTDETQLFCLQLLRDSAPDLQPVRDRCLIYLMERVDHDTIGLVNARVVSERIRIRDETSLATTRLAQYFATLPPEQYEGERAALSQKIGPVCVNLTKDQCVSRILNGRIIPGLQALVLDFLRERQQ